MLPPPVGRPPTRLLAPLPAPLQPRASVPEAEPPTLGSPCLQILQGRGRGRGDAAGKGRKRKARRGEDAGAALLPAEDEDDEEGWVFFIVFPFLTRRRDGRAGQGGRHGPPAQALSPGP